LQKKHLWVKRSYCRRGTGFGLATKT
jgi:hypothetical protein